MPFLPPNQQHQSTEGTKVTITYKNILRHKELQNKSNTRMNFHLHLLHANHTLISNFYQHLPTYTTRSCWQSGHQCLQSMECIHRWTDNMKSENIFDSGPSVYTLPSVLWRCWLGSRKGIQPVKNWVVGCWRGSLPGASCRLAHGPADATATHCLLLQ